MCIIGLGTDWSGVLTMQKADQEQVDEGILRCLQMARDTITTMEDNFNAGRPGFSCDVIDEIDKNIRLLTRQPIQVDEEEEQPPMDKETAGDMKYHALKDEGLLDKFGRRKQ